jgi:hypothetical protein
MVHRDQSRGEVRESGDYIRFGPCEIDCNATVPLVRFVPFDEEDTEKH